MEFDINSQTTNIFDQVRVLKEAGSIERKYDKAGRVYSVIDHNKNETRNTYYNTDGQIDHEDILGGANSHIQYHYDDAGNMTSHTVTVDGGSGAQGYTNTYVRTYDGYKLKSESGTSTYFDPGQEDYEYDARGRLISTHDEKGQHDQKFILNAYGEIVQKTENGSTSNWYYQDGKIVGEIDADGKVNFDNNYTPVSEHYPALTPSSYTVAKGDTLVTIAAQVYGDSSLWYQIAAANGLKDDSGLVTGMILTIPNNITTTHATSNTFKPFSNDFIIGDTTPTLPTPPPPDDDDGGCGGIGGILVAVVTIGAAILTGQPGFLSAISSGLGLAAGSTAATIAGAVAAGAVIDTASQLASMAVGLQDGFNLKELGVSALSAFAGAEVASAFGDVAKLTGPQLLEKGLLTDAVGQGIGNAVGMTHGFNWAEFAGSGLRAELGATSLGKQLTNTPAGIGNDLIDVGLQALSNNGHLSAASVGASIGSNFVAYQQAQQTQHIKPKVYEEEEEELANSSLNLQTGTKPLDQMYTMDYLNQMQADREMFDRLMDPSNLSDFRMPGVQDVLPADLETLKAQTATDSNTAWRDQLTLADKANLLAAAQQGGMIGADLDGYVHHLFGDIQSPVASKQPVLQLWQDENGVQHEGDSPYFPHDRTIDVEGLTAKEMSSTIGDQVLMNKSIDSSFLSSDSLGIINDTVEVSDKIATTYAKSRAIGILNKAAPLNAEKVLQLASAEHISDAKEIFSWPKGKAISYLNSFENSPGYTLLKIGNGLNKPLQLLGLGADMHNTYVSKNNNSNEIRARETFVTGVRDSADIVASTTYTTAITTGAVVTAATVVSAPAVIAVGALAFAGSYASYHFGGLGDSIKNSFGDLARSTWNYFRGIS